MIDLEGPTPLYVQIADVIMGRIADGTYPPGRRIPSTAAIADEFGVSRRTATESLRLLRNRKAVFGVRGRGTFVATDESPRP
ncbi:winged helix-turn-helix domain-containing protein [Spirillospora sp. NPDC000708]